MRLVSALASADENEAARRTTVADAIADLVSDLGFELGFGVSGGAVMPIVRALDARALRVVHCRHEAGAAFAAAEAFFASGRPAAVFTTTGPGITNALTGIAAARWEGAKLLMLSGTTSAWARGRSAFQETSAYTAPICGLVASEPLVHFAHTIEDPRELPTVARRLSAGFAREDGFVAHLGLPLALQTRDAAMMIGANESILAPAASSEVMERIAERLQRCPFSIWVGFGARHAAHEVRALADRTGALVACSPRGKGIFPEDHPQFAGVTGFGGHGVEARLARSGARLTLVLGTRLGEFTSFWNPALVPPEGFVHVDLDESVPGRAYPNAPTVGVVAEIRRFLCALLERLPATRRPPVLAVEATPAATPAGSRAPVRTSALIDAVQRVVVDRSDAIVMTEAGNAFAWGSRFRFRTPGRYRVSTGFAAMGQATAGVVGAAIGGKRKAVAIVGDGAMLMNNEVSTAVQYRLPAVWIVLNDSRYGMIEQGMRAQGWAPVATDLPETDFAMIARAMGADAAGVSDEADLDDALERAMDAPGPFVLDVRIDRNEPAPIGARIDQLIEEGACAEERS